ncbi:MAG: segregation/condensation protein A [bacterium]|nr:segregation/condensation protein A [Bacillota bacterium]HHW54263.1 segregation/condensation protein A [Bacillota bacterium]
MSYQVRLQNFQGPFDLLCHLIEKDKIDIYDIPIAQITREYLEYLNTWEDMDIDEASEFLLLACKLIEIKARLLLPQKQGVTPEEEIIDPREELVERLLEYKLFRRLSALLEEIARDQEKIFTRAGDDPAHWFPEGKPLEAVTLTDLTEAFRAVLQQAASVPTIPLRERMISIEEKIQELRQALPGANARLWFKDLFTKRSDRLDIIATFLALLELIHRGELKAYQANTFGDILILRCGE